MPRSRGSSNLQRDALQPMVADGKKRQRLRFASELVAPLSKPRSALLAFSSVPQLQTSCWAFGPGGRPWLAVELGATRAFLAFASTR